MADSGNPLLLSPGELWQQGHSQLQAFLPSRSELPIFFFLLVCGRDGRKAQGYLWSNHYSISSPQRPHCIRLSVGSPLPRSTSPCHFPSLSFPIYLSSNPCLLYSVPHPDALWAVTAVCWMLDVTEDTVLSWGGRETVCLSINNPSEMKTSFILPQMNRLREIMPSREWIWIGFHRCRLITYSVGTD